jgi:hypothetical protein
LSTQKAGNPEAVEAGRPGLLEVDEVLVLHREKRRVTSMKSSERDDLQA